MWPGGFFMPDQFLPLPFPLAGVDITNEENQQRPNTAAVGVNVRGRDPIHRRMRGGSRPGLSRYVDAQVSGANLIQHLNTITTINEDALPANQWNADWEKFYFSDPSTPSEFGWTYIGSYDALIDPYWVPDPSDNLPAFRGKDKRPLPPEICTLNPPVANPKKVRPIIGWVTPADIEFPTPLSATQLSPTAKHPQTGEPVPGTFAFFPPKGTVLAIGAKRPLRTIFTPTNLDKFFPAKKEVEINVVAYAGGTTIYSGYSYPNTLNVLVQWPVEFGGDVREDTISWRTTATFDGAGTWTVQNLNYILADLSVGNASGLLTLLATSTGLDTLTPGSLAAGVPTRIRVVSPTEYAVDWSMRAGETYGTNGYSEFTTSFPGRTPPPTSISLTIEVGTITLSNGTSGATLAGDMLITITGP